LVLGGLPKTPIKIKILKNCAKNKKKGGGGRLKKEDKTEDKSPFFSCPSVLTYLEKMS